MYASIKHSLIFTMRILVSPSSVLCSAKYSLDIDSNAAQCDLIVKK